MNLLLVKATAIELTIISLGLYKFPYTTLSIFGLLGINKMLNEFSKTNSKLVNNKKINAALYHPFEKDKFIVDKIDVPKFSKNQVLIEVRGAAVNPIDGKLITPLIPFVRWFIPPTIGRDFSGIVVDIGKDVTKFKIGDEVFGNAKGGSLQQFTVADQNVIAHKPSNLTYTESAGISLSGTTTLQSLTYWGDLNGKKILILGASGGCGSLGIQIAKYYDTIVYGVCSTRNVEYVRSIGADFVVDYTKKDYLNVLENEKFDLIFDTVTSIEDPDQEVIYRKYLKSDGKYVALNAKPLDSLKGYINGLLNINLERPNYHRHIVKWKNEDLLLLKKMAEENKLKPKIQNTYYLEEKNVKLAFEGLKSRRTTGKIVFEI